LLRDGGGEEAVGEVLGDLPGIAEDGRDRGVADMDERPQ